MTSGVDVNVLAVIPARFNSTRFPGKVLAPLLGKPLVLHTYERTTAAKLVQKTLIATDDLRVQKAAQEHGADVVMTSPEHSSGTDRIAEVAANSDADIIVNVQGDEPLIDPAIIDATIQALLDAPDVPMATARRKITDLQDIADPNVVKVVCDRNGRALYFSRCPIPAIRDAGPFDTGNHWQHIGLYAYRRDFLLQYAKMEATPLEKLEKLEQLRVLENGYPITVIDTKYTSIGVDTPEDLERVRETLTTQLAQ